VLKYDTTLMEANMRSRFRLSLVIKDQHRETCPGHWREIVKEIWATSDEEACAIFLGNTIEPLSENINEQNYNILVEEL
jgi:hypothetical protein